ncbi:hypothetical protein X943_002768 [Babesia divergens]|uniref:Uncharacterized protein n=1 Tax=Babesia divergens TaxID=32595 RepID=A0AAD9G7E4_BABDI|nr:hypothetical protein X943_002768 [Babesia divergens]
MATLSSSEDSCSSGSEIEETWEGEGLAYSLFDDFSSPFASHVYRHMESKFGFDYSVLGKGTLHRIALITYLERERANGADVLECYKKLCSNPSIVMDKFEAYINPPFKNEKLLWDFMESSDEEADESLMSHHLHQEKIGETATRPQKSVKGDDDYFKSYKNLGIHREMVLDKVRTGAYESFINLNRHYFKDKVVLDIGSGSGILSLLAARAGAKLVIGIDNCENMVNMATEHSSLNGLSNVQFLHGKVEDSDLVYVDGVVRLVRDPDYNGRCEPFKCDILVSEWMGYGCLYENMLPSVLCARDKYLKEAGFMVPSKVKLGVSAVFYLHQFLQFFGLDMYKKLTDKMNKWNEPVYGLLLSGLKWQGAELLKEPAVDIADPSCIVSDANGICLIDLKKVSESELSISQDFEVKVHEGKSCSTLALYFDCIFEPPNVASSEYPAILNLSPMSFGTLESYREDLPSMDKSKAFCTSPAYEGSERDDGVVVVMSTRPDQTPTHWKQVLLHLMDHDVNPVRLEGVLSGRISLMKNSNNSRWLDILLHLRDSSAASDSYYKLI